MPSNLIKIQGRELQFGDGAGSAPVANTEFSRADDLRIAPKTQNKLAKDYRMQDFIWRALFGIITVNSRMFRIPQFGPEAWADWRGIADRLDQDQPRSLIRSFSTEIKELVDRWLATRIMPIEAAEADDALRKKLTTAQGNIRFLRKVFEMMYEIDAATLIQAWASYSASHRKELTGGAGAYYHDDNTNGTPWADIEAAINAGVNAGRIYNTIAGPRQWFSAMANSPTFKGTNEGPLSLEDLKKKLAGQGLTNVIVSSAIKHDLNAGTNSLVWGSNWGWIGRVELGAPSEDTACFGYAFQRQGTPETWQHKDGLSKVEYQVVAECQTLIGLDYTAGYLFKTPLEP